MVKIGVLIPQVLRDRMEQHYLAERMTMSEFVAMAIANSLGEPELGNVPRVPRGRRPKRRPEEAPAP
jgi:hypothetical protein